MTAGLTDRFIVNTRAPHQAPVLDDMLRARGAVPLDYPCIEIIPVDDSLEFDASLRDLAGGSFHWLALTSANTVFALARRLDALGIRLDGARFQTAAVGPSTRDAARDHLGLEASVLPEKFVAESFALALPAQPGERVLLPESAIARPVLAKMLRERGADVTVVTAYRTVPGHGGVDVPGLLKQGSVDAITFTSSSTVDNFVERVRREGGLLSHALELCAACIGPVTADAARQNGFIQVVVPEEYTLTGMTDALEDFFGRLLPEGEHRS